SFRNQTMKLAVLFFLLATSGVGALEVNVDVSGEVTCSVPFKYRVLLWEEDINRHDLIGKKEPSTIPVRYPSGHYPRWWYWSEIPVNQTCGDKKCAKASFHVEGKAWDAWVPLMDDVEPVLTIEHTCWKLNADLGRWIKCICKKWGSIKHDLHETKININLESTVL
ncbi:hypothetical protein PENTCL1PPCAC_19104, partial [Pristionchus entomophagus]